METQKATNECDAIVGQANEKNENEADQNQEVATSDNNDDLQNQPDDGNVTENKKAEDVEQSESMTSLQENKENEVFSKDEQIICNSKESAHVTENEDKEASVRHYEKEKVKEINDQTISNPESVLENENIMTVESTTKKLLAQYKSFALQTELHSTLIKTKEPLMFVILCLGNENPDVISEALAILHLLIQKPENRPVLCGTEHIFDALAQLIENPSLPQETISFATMVYDFLKRTSALPKSSGQKCGKSKSNRGKSNRTKVNSSFSKSKPVYLYIPYNVFFKERRNKITQTLQQDKDVLSITFDMKKCFCVIRVKLHATPEVFGKAVANLGYECYLVALNEKNEEVKVQMTPDAKINEGVYEYLSESDEEKDKSMEEKIIATEDDIKKTDGKKKGWLSAAAGFVQKSFYW